MNDRFLRACRRQSVDCTPIWLMRQAGRFLPEYRALRQRHPMMEMIKTPELAVEVTLQPIRRFELDAAIIFADILPPLEAMGVSVEFVRGEGPSIAQPIRAAADIDKLVVPSPEEIAPYTQEAVRLAARELNGRVPLIGFSGAPFTLAGYLIEGGSSADYARARRLMYDATDAWHSLMEKLSLMVGAYLQAQVRAGAQALQLFDSWVGVLSPADYREFVLPYVARTVAMARQAGVPVIYFSTGTAGMLETIATTGADVIGIDWRVDLGEAWKRVGYGVAIQGNLDPLTLLAPLPKLQDRVLHVLGQAGRRDGHIFNLGHGVLQDTPVDNVKALVDLVHRETQRS